MQDAKGVVIGGTFVINNEGILDAQGQQGKGCGCQQEPRDE
jgi:hypothetical protein